MTTTYTVIGFHTVGEDAEAGYLFARRHILGNCNSYSKAVALCNAWRLDKPLRRTMILLVKKGA